MTQPQNARGTATAALADSYYFSRPDFVDGTTEFHRLLAKYLRPGASILEVGAGPSNSTTSFLSTLGPVTGLDVSDEIENNSTLAAKYVFDGNDFPFDSDCFDACVSNYVLEHVADTERHFREVARVLRDGGAYCFRTPNVWHYVSLAAKLLPHSFHLRLANPLRGNSADAHDPYTTFYRANSARRVRQLCYRSGLMPLEIRHVEREPSYGRLHPALFYPMMAYERVVNFTKILAPIRANLFVVLQKPAHHLV